MRTLGTLSQLTTSAVSFLVALSALCAWAGDDKNGVAPNTISLPKGPGSIEGLGEAFQPSLNTGTGKHAVGLKLPPGTAGHTPQMALVYEGGNGNGVLGPGWSIPLAFVQRQTDKGVPRYVDGPNGLDDDFDGEIDEPDELDRFINEGSEELVPVQDGGQVSFFPRNEGAFIRYRRLGDHWEGTRPDGTRLVFGESSTARVADASNPTNIFRWLLEQEIDTLGNSIRYSYATFPGETNLAQVYLRAIEYGPGPAPWGGNFHFAFFNYEDREDWFEDCRSGFAIRTGKRLREITIGTQGAMLPGHLQGDFNEDGTGDCLNRRYVLGYKVGIPRSLLTSIMQVGADGLTAYPPATYGYTECQESNILSAAEAWIVSLNAPPVVFDQGTVDFIDLNGDGLPDLLRTGTFGGAHQVYFNQGETNVAGQATIQWSAPEEVAHTVGGGDPWDLGLEQNEVILSDIDGDGLSDLVQMTPFSTYYYPCSPPLDGTARWGARRPLGVADYIPPSPYGSGGSVRTLDADFDKRTDIVKSISVGSGFRYQIWFNRGGDAYSLRTTVGPPTGYDFTVAGVQIADLNGDRLQDVAWIRPTRVLYTASLGHGQFLEESAIFIPDVTLSTAQIAKASLRDINGDGLADLVVDRPQPQTIWVWLNRGNRTFSDRIIITDLPAINAVRWVDLNGNGTVDMVFGDSSRGASERVLAVDLGRLLGGSPRPGLLNRIQNGIGRVQTLVYETSTRFALEDGTTTNGYRYAWPYPLPFPVEVVSEIRTADSLGHQYVTQFRYHDGYYDPVEKQFRGFARVEQVDVGDVTAPTLVTRSHFDTGRDFEAMKGKLLRLTAEQEDGSAFTDESTAWTLPPVTLYTGTNGTNVTYVHPTANVKLVKELGQGTERRLESEFAYDNFGNQTTNTDYGIVVAGDRSAFNDERIATTEYAINTNAWILRTPARQETKDENGDIIARSELFYDDETFAGNNRGLVTVGNLTLKRDWISPSNSNATISSARTKYDSYGNPTTILDPLANAAGFAAGHAREIAYDAHFHSYPVSETIHLGGGKEPLIFQAAYDEGFGTVNSSSDFNTNTTSYGYDNFARLTSIVKPGDSPAYPTVEYDYALAVPFAATNLVNYVETRQLDKMPGTVGTKRDHYLLSRQFVDGLGRKLITKQEAEPASGSGTPRVVVSGAVQFNARQQAVRALNPFFSVQGSSLDELLAFENIESPGWLGQFHHEGSLVTLNLANAHASSTVYDATLRPVRVSNPDDTQRRTIYEPLLTRSFDENDNDPTSPYHDTPMVHANDGLGRFVRVEEISRLNDDGTSAGTLKTWTTCYEYDLNDQLTRITDSQANIKNFAYDGLKRKTDMNDPDRGVMHFVYDDASNLTETTDAKGQRISYTYDGANRIRTEKYHDGLPAPAWRSGRGDDALTNSVLYHYDEPIPNLPQGDTTTTTGRNARGALAWVEDLSGEEHTSYDQRGRVEWVVKRTPDPLLFSQSLLTSAATSLVGYKTAFAYDSLDRLTNLTYPDADQLRYEYNDRNLLQRIPGGFTSGQAQPGNILSNLLYLPSGQMAQIDYGNGVRTTYAYDSRLRLKQLLTHHVSRITEPLINFAYDFDGVSNIKSIADLRPGSTVPEGDPRRNTQFFQYDDLYRLTRVQYSFALPGAAARNDGEINYRYDRIGNMLAQTSTLNHQEQGLPVANLGTMESGGTAGRSGRIGRQVNDPPGPHALTRINPQPSTTNSQPRQYPYDANGNMTDIDGLQCTWDFKDRLVAVENAEMRADYTYDYTDRRIAKDVSYKPGSANFTNHDSRITTLYINKYFEVREHDAPTKYVWNGNTRVARVTGSLNTNVRVQRLRVYAGWNLVSLAVSCSLSNLQSEIGDLLSAHRWNPADQTWVAISPSEMLPSGTVLWLQATTNAILTVSGLYADPTNRTVSASGDFLPSAGLEAWDLLSAISNLPSATAWTYDAAAASWLSWLPPPIQAQSDLPALIAPGQAAFARADAPAQLEVPESALRIRYYHQDHLGSSSFVTDALGRTVDWIAFYPFGHCRKQFQLDKRAENFQFFQKERDRESGLSYFNTRHLDTAFARFLSVDSAVFKPAKGIRSVESLNPYGYCANQPLSFGDDSGAATVALLNQMDSAKTMTSSYDNARSTSMLTQQGLWPWVAKLLPMLDTPTLQNVGQIQRSWLKDDPRFMVCNQFVGLVLVRAGILKERGQDISISGLRKFYKNGGGDGFSEIDADQRSDDTKFSAMLSKINRGDVLFFNNSEGDLVSGKQGARSHVGFADKVVTETVDGAEVVKGIYILDQSSTKGRPTSTFWSLERLRGDIESGARGLNSVGSNSAEEKQVVPP